jgi:hypothetical protein
LAAPQKDWIIFYLFFHPEVLPTLMNVAYHLNTWRFSAIYIGKKTHHNRKQDTKNIVLFRLKVA